MLKVTNVEELQAKLAELRKAQKEYSTFTQKQVDKIFRAASLAINKNRIKLAKMAVEETRMGIVEDKIIKNHFASEFIYNKYKDSKTCGVIERDEAFGITKIAEPIGVVGAIVPTTNPTSTAAFKALISLKTRNAVMFSPHPRAKNCTIEAAKIVMEAAEAAGAPKGLIGWVDEPSVVLSGELMKNVDIILATGGPGMVRAAYSSGRPAIGVGAGNTPVVVDESADIKMAVSSILLSKTFDNGVICASEQAVLAPASIYDEIKKEFVKRGAYILNEKETQMLRDKMFPEGHLNGEVVGQSAYKIAQICGFEVPEEAKVLMPEISEVEFSEPLAHEKLSPVLSLYKTTGFEDSLAKADRLIEQGGMGHTSVMYADELRASDRVAKFGQTMKTGRTLINMPAAQGAIGDVFNFDLAPSLTLGCGSWGNNSVSENVGVEQLYNVKTIAERRENMLWFKVPAKTYFKYGSLPVALTDLKGKKRAVIVTDKVLASLGYTDHVTTVLEELGIDYRIFSDVQADPVLSVVKSGAELMRNYEPDVIIALGGGSPMDAAKIMWVMYEHPTVEFEDLAVTYMDVRKRIITFPKLGKKAEFVAVATSAGTGSEVTPFAVITDDETGIKYPLADYELTPNMAIVDPQLMLSMPAGLTSASGIDVLTHAVEAYVSVLATDFTNPLALDAIKLVFEFLPESVRDGAEAKEAKERMANASCMAGMAFANAALGICHSMAHKLGAAFHIPHGIANALLLNEVIKFNATDKPVKMAGFSQYKYPNAKSRYAKIADFLGLGGKDRTEKVANLINKINELKAEINIPASIQEWGVKEADFLAELDEMVEQAFDDQCTGANPRYPLFTEIKELYLAAYYGPEAYAAKKAAEDKADKAPKKEAKAKKK